MKYKHFKEVDGFFVNEITGEKYDKLSEAIPKPTKIRQFFYWFLTFFLLFAGVSIFIVAFTSKIYHLTLLATLLIIILIGYQLLHIYLKDNRWGVEFDLGKESDFFLKSFINKHEELLKFVDYFCVGKVNVFLSSFEGNKFVKFNNDVIVLMFEQKRFIILNDNTYLDVNADFKFYRRRPIQLTYLVENFEFIDYPPSSGANITLQRYAHLTKDGNPDRRYSNNRIVYSGNVQTITIKIMGKTQNFYSKRKKDFSEEFKELNFFILGAQKQFSTPDAIFSFENKKPETNWLDPPITRHPFAEKSPALKDEPIKNIVASETPQILAKEELEPETNCAEPSTAKQPPVKKSAPLKRKKKKITRIVKKPQPVIQEEFEPQKFFKERSKLFNYPVMDAVIMNDIYYKFAVEYYPHLGEFADSAGYKLDQNTNLFIRKEFASLHEAIMSTVLDGIIVAKDELTNRKYREVFYSLQKNGEIFFCGNLAYLVLTDPESSLSVYSETIKNIYHRIEKQLEGNKILVFSPISRSKEMLLLCEKYPYSIILNNILLRFNLEVITRNMWGEILSNNIKDITRNDILYSIFVSLNVDTMHVEEFQEYVNDEFKNFYNFVIIKSSLKENGCHIVGDYIFKSEDVFRKLHPER